MALVDVPTRPSAAARRYAHLVGLAPRHLTSYPGSATTWQNARLPSEGAFVVELPDGALSAPAADRHVRAVLALAAGPAIAARAAPAAAPRPPIVQRPIPFGDRRRAETAAYSARHYGRRTWRLESPAVIVQHFSVTDSADAVHRTFAPDRRDPELGELPGTCAHFVVDRDGTIQQLVDVGTICRHALGLNHTAIGIEHVGRSDRAVMGNPRQLAASLRLTRWLRCRHGIATRDVIGHAESLSSPHFLERVPGLDDYTHSDFGPAAMRTYRRRLAAMPCGPPDAREAAEAARGAG
jgi:beta-N-acetylhexosaminidase